MRSLLTDQWLTEWWKLIGIRDLFDVMEDVTTFVGMEQEGRLDLGSQPPVWDEATHASR